MKQRYVWLDLWRSLAVLVMLAFHTLWDLEHFGVLASGTMETPFANVIRYVFGGSFILSSGLLVLRGRDPLRRGFFLFCVGLAVAVATTALGLPVKFGILQLIGVYMMLCALLRKPLTRLRGLWSAGVCALLFAGAWVLTARVTVDWPYLYPLGLRSADFVSSDYWPLLPWGFLYLLGTQLSPALLRAKAGERRLPAALTFLGRHSLIVYLAHQPVIYGILWLFFSKSP